MSSIYERIGGQTAINAIVDIFYAKMQDDYRINRFFNSVNVNEQTNALKALLTALFGGSNPTEEEFIDLLDNFFMTAFARSKRKGSVSGSDFGFLGIMIAQDHPSTQYLCDNHCHLLRFMPDDFHYDAVMEHLAATLQQINLDSAVRNEVLALAEKARNGVLGI